MKAITNDHIFHDFICKKYLIELNPQNQRVDQGLRQTGQVGVQVACLARHKLRSSGQREPQFRKCIPHIGL